MMDLVDMPGSSIHSSIFRLWTYHLKKVGGGSRDPFVLRNERYPNFGLVNFFCMRDGLPRKTTIKLLSIWSIAGDIDNQKGYVFDFWQTIPMFSNVSLSK